MTSSMSRTACTAHTSPSTEDTSGNWTGGSRRQLGECEFWPGPTHVRPGCTNCASSAGWPLFVVRSRTTKNRRSLRRPGDLPSSGVTGAPRESWRLRFLRTRDYYSGFPCPIEGILILFRWNVPAEGMEPLLVVPGDPFHRFEHH